MSKRTLLFPIAVLLIGIIGAIGVGRELEEVNRETAHARFEGLSRRVTSALVERFRTYEYGLRGARGAVIAAGGETITRERFWQYIQSREPDREFPGARGFGFIRLVREGEEERFVAAARLEDRPDFRILQLQPHLGELFVIQYLEPEAANLQAIGLDIASNPSRRLAALTSARTGQPVLTAPITLVQALRQPEQGFLFLLPVFRPDRQPQGPEERWQALIGWAYAPIIINEVLADFDFRDGEFALVLQDVEYADHPKTFYRSALSDEDAAGGLVTRTPLELYGRDWVVEIRALPPFYRGLNLSDPRWAGGSILALAALIASLAYIYLLGVQRKIAASAEKARHQALVEQGARQQRIAERLQLAAEAAGMGVAEYESPTRQLNWDARQLEIYGIKGEDFSGTVQDWLARVLPDDRAFVAESFERALSTKDRFDAGFRITRGDGAVRTVRALGQVRGDETGGLRLVSVTLDVTEQKLNEEALKQNGRFLSAVTENIPAMISYWDAGLHCHFMNGAMLQFVGRSAEEVEGFSMDGVLDWGTWQRCRGHIEAALCGEPQRFEDSMPGAGDRPERHLWWHVMPDRDADGVHGLYAVISDISELKQAQIRLEELNVALMQQSEMAESASRAKSEFLANMSHEIRTPMNAVLGLAYLLEKSELNAAAREMVRKIQKAGRSLLGILNDILDFSKIEAHRLDIESQPFRLGDVLDELANTMAYASEGKKVEVAVWPVPPGAAVLIGDALRLRQVLTNLAGNAIKFTERGEVSLRVEITGQEGDRLTLRFSVVDTGIGIPPEKQQEIFFPFSQADSSTSRRFGGTGLGLAISRQLVELMGGRLEVHSAAGQGSEFFFELPFQVGETLVANLPVIRPQRVLIVDDHPLARETLVAIVAGLGWTAEVAGSGATAVEILRTARASGRPFDVVLLDWRLPGMAGLTAAATIRAQLGEGDQPLILLVAAAEREDLRKHPDSGLADSVLTKPVTSSTLLDTMLELATKGPDRAIRKQLPSPSSRRLDGLRVLVVDDSEINREVALGILEGEGARVVLAEDGSVALDCLSREAEGFDVVLMDVQMPVMDGYEATRRIRASDALRALPVIAVTAGAFHDQHEAALSAGMNGFIAKPFAPEDLISQLQKCRRGPAEGAPSTNAVEQSQARGDEQVLVDTRLGLRLWRTRASYGNYMGRFVETHADDARKIAESIDVGDTDAAASLAHKLRGAAGAMALKRLAGIAAELEVRLKEGGQAGPLVDRLRRAMDSTLEEIAAFLAEQGTSEATRDDGEQDVRQRDRRLAQLLAALDSDSPDEAEALVEALAAALPVEYVRRLRQHLTDFEFREAEALVRELMGSVGVSRE